MHHPPSAAIGVRKKLKLIVVATCGTLLVSLGLAVAPASGAENEILGAVQRATPGTVNHAINVAPDPSEKSALATSQDQVDVNVPRDPREGITITIDNEKVKMGLPFAAQASDAKAQKDGVVSYDNQNGTTTVPVVTNDSRVQVNTVIHDRGAPTRFEYPLTLPSGVELRPTDDGGFVAISDTGAGLFAIGAPWAKGAEGNSVPTHYEMDGSSLVQVVDHVQANVRYPVVADPTAWTEWWGMAVKLTHSETVKLSNNCSPAYFTTAFCGFAGPFSVPCGLAASARLWTWEKPIKDAARQGRCAQLNMPWGSGIALWNVTNETC